MMWGFVPTLESHRKSLGPYSRAQSRRILRLGKGTYFEARLGGTLGTLHGRAAYGSFPGWEA